jgi:thiol:disulfide interchange protein DsbD
LVKKKKQNNFSKNILMQKIIISVLSFFFFLGINAQSQNPVSWQASYKSTSATEGEIIIRATIEKGWHTYSQKPTDAGPIPTNFKFTEVKNYSLIGKTEESNAHEEFVKAFDAKIAVFSDKAEFKQKIKFSKAGFAVSVKIEYMCCNDMMCLPPKTLDLEVRIQ